MFPFGAIVTQLPTVTPSSPLGSFSFVCTRVLISRAEQHPEVRLLFTQGGHVYGAEGAGMPRSRWPAPFWVPPATADAPGSPGVAGLVFFFWDVGRFRGNAAVFPVVLTCISPGEDTMSTFS